MGTGFCLISQLMKKNYSFVGFLLLALLLFALGQVGGSAGITFFKGDWKSLLSQSRKSGKMIFVDVYTTWCGPCKRMEQEVFPLAEVGKVYNASFVNYRLNAELGEGIELAKRFAVRSYPAYLFLDTSGTLVYRTGDFMQAAEFIAAGKLALSKGSEAAVVKSLEASFLGGKRDPEFLKNLLTERKRLEVPNTEVLNAYVATLSAEQRRSKEMLLFLVGHIGNQQSDALEVLVKGMPVLDVADQRFIADELYGGMLYYALGTAVKDGRTDEAKKLFSAVQSVYPLLNQKHHASVENLSLHYCQMVRDAEGLKKVGRLMAEQVVHLPLDSIRRKDKLLFDQAMAPFLSGQQDSTKIPGFAEEKKFAARQFSANVASTLYTVSNAFKAALEVGDPGLHEALNWMNFAVSVYQNEAILKLRAELEALVAQSP
ncbi:MAG: thioredoxin family protein [Pedobacter sp.]|nr:MAG: thioredoxin family protein [Pedobacter sp.]